MQSLILSNLIFGENFLLLVFNPCMENMSFPLGNFMIGSGIQGQNIWVKSNCPEVGKFPACSDLHPLFPILILFCCAWTPAIVSCILAFVVEIFAHSLPCSSSFSSNSCHHHQSQELLKKPLVPLVPEMGDVDLFAGSNQGMICIIILRCMSTKLTCSRKNLT